MTLTNQGLVVGQATKTDNQSGAYTAHDVMHSLSQRVDNNVMALTNREFRLSAVKVLRV